MLPRASIAHESPCRAAAATGARANESHEIERRVRLSSRGDGRQLSSVRVIPVGILRSPLRVRDSDPAPPRSRSQCSEEMAFKVMGDFAAAGGNFIDTADVYNAGRRRPPLPQPRPARSPPPLLTRPFPFPFPAACARTTSL